VIGQSRCYRRGALLPGSIRGSDTPRSRRPANMIAIEGEVRRRLIRLPALREAVSRATLPHVTVSVGLVTPLQERGITPSSTEWLARARASPADRCSTRPTADRAQMMRRPGRPSHENVSSRAGPESCRSSRRARRSDRGGDGPKGCRASGTPHNQLCGGERDQYRLRVDTPLRNSLESSTSSFDRTIPLRTDTGRAHAGR
jgi:hypothetical protein